MGFCFLFILIKVEHFLDRNGDRRVVFRVYLHDVSHHVPPFLRDRIDAIRCVLRVTFTRALLIPEEDIGVFVPKDGIVAYSAVLDHLDEFRPDSGMSLLILFLTAWLEEHFECKSCHSQVFLKLKRPPLIPLGGRLVRGYLMECIGVKYRKINIYSQLSDYNSQKIILCERNSTLPPLICYISISQYVR